MTFSKRKSELPGQWFAGIMVTETPCVPGTSDLESNSRGMIYLGSTRSCCLTRLAVTLLQYYSVLEFRLLQTNPQDCF